MSKLKSVDIYRLTNKEEYELAIELIQKIIKTLKDLEEYYYKLLFFEEQDEIKKERNWYKKELAKIKEDYIDYLRNNEVDKND